MNQKKKPTLAPAFADCKQDDVDTALCWWGELTGKRGTTWAHPDGPISFPANEAGELRHAAYGLATLARLAVILQDEGEERKTSSFISGGIASAIYALANVVHERVAE